MPKFYDDNSIDILARDEGSLARVISKKMTNVSSRQLRKLMTTLNGSGTGATATLSRPYVVQATDGKTGGLVTIGSKTELDRLTVTADVTNVQLMLENAVGWFDADRLDYTVILDFSRLE